MHQLQQFLLKVYKGELENQKPYNAFSDFIQTFTLFRGKQGKDEDDMPPTVGEFKVLFYHASAGSSRTSSFCWAGRDVEQWLA